MPATRTPRVSIVGAGAVGCSIGRSLHDAGYAVVSVISRTGSDAVSLARSVSCKRASTQVRDLSPETEVIILSVPDGAIGGIAAEIARLKTLKFRKVFAAHCSGVRSADLLAPLRRRGVLVASMHPIQTFPAGRRARARIRGIYFGIEGEPEALKRAEKIAGDLGARALTVRKELKPLYHAVCVFASNYMMVQLNAVSELTKRIGGRVGWEALFGPLMTATMENAVSSSPAGALTGPVVRGDLSTIELHLGALSEYAPQFLPLYISDGIEAARIGRERESISGEDFSRIVGRCRRFLKSESFRTIGKVKR